MDKNSLKKILEKKPEGPIERYTHEKNLSDKYGNEGIKVYLLMDGQTSAEEIMKKIGLEEGKFIEIINYMEDSGMLESEEPISPLVEMPATPVKPREEPKPVEKPEPKESVFKPVEAPAPPLKPAEEFPIAKPKESVFKPVEVPAPPIKPKEESTPVEKPEPREFILKPVEELPAKPKESVFKPVEAPAPPVKPAEEFPIAKPRGEVQSIPMVKTEDVNFKEWETPKVNELPLEKPKEGLPSIPMLKTEGIVAAEEKSSALKALVATEKPKEEPYSAPIQKAYGKPRIPKTPLEKKLYSKFGDDGLYAYSLIDEFKTPREIVKQSGMSEERLKEIIGFMNDEGIIKLERPIVAPVEEIHAEEKRIHEKTQMQPPKLIAPFRAPPVVVPLQPKPSAQPPQPVAQPKPMPPKPVEKPESKELISIPISREEICVPTAVPMKLVNKLRVEGELLRRYGNDGSKVLSLMNGKKVSIKIMKELKMKPTKFDEIASFLLDAGAIKIQCLTPDNVRELYGEEGLSIYSKYGRDGILLYEFIDKKSSLKDIVKMSGIEPKLAVEIFAFIHKVLGLDIPIDTELLYKQLGIRP